MNMLSGTDCTDNHVIDIAVIGGGASGMAAAIFAQRTFKETSQESGSVTVFERNDRVGKKLLMTGNGRCNLTNLDTDLYHYHGNDVRFAKGALFRYPPAKVMSFFEELGVVFTVEESQKVYPMSLSAASVLDSLRLSMNELGIQVKTGSQVIGINRDGNEFVISLADRSTFRALSVIVAAGGMCAPSTGSDGNGYKLLSAFAHRLLAPVPSIVQIKTDTKFCKPLSGNKILGSASLFISGRKVREEAGEILFTDYGLSGPPILQLSGYVSREMAGISGCGSESNIFISLDFLPDYSLDEVHTMMMMRKITFPDRKLEEYLTGLFHKRLALGILRKATDKPLSAVVATLSDKDIDTLASACKAMKIQVTGTMTFANAQTTAGGIDTSDFDPSTLASVKCPGLFACGEILDIDGDCGGFNLQWAWSSGFLSGSSAAQYVIKARNL